MQHDTGLAKKLILKKYAILTSTMYMANVNMTCSPPRTSATVTAAETIFMEKRVIQDLSRDTG